MPTGVKSMALPSFANETSARVVVHHQAPRLIANPGQAHHPQVLGDEVDSAEARVVFRPDNGLPEAGLGCGCGGEARLHAGHKRLGFGRLDPEPGRLCADPLDRVPERDLPLGLHDACLERHQQLPQDAAAAINAPTEGGDVAGLRVVKNPAHEPGPVFDAEAQLLEPRANLRLPRVDRLHDARDRPRRGDRDHRLDGTVASLLDRLGELCPRRRLLARLPRRAQPRQGR